MDYLEIIISVTPKELGGELLIAELSAMDFESFADSENGFSAYIPKEKYVEDSIKLIFSNYSDILKIEFTEKIIPQQNWNTEWESHFEPIDVDGKCYIRAPFHEAKKNYEFDLVIEPKMSFGTGHHNTTQLMIQKLMQLNVKNKLVLDVGCGTGVLAILASKMGAGKITAVDIDDWSYENSIENIQKNNIENITVLKGTVENVLEKNFFTILANINKNVLMQDLPIYVKLIENTGNLVISGFFDTDVSQLQEKSETFGLQLKDKQINEGWAMLHFVKQH